MHTPLPQNLPDSAVLSILSHINLLISVDIVESAFVNHVSLKHIIQLSLYSYRNIEHACSSSNLFLSDRQLPVMIDGSGGLYLRHLSLTLKPPFLPRLRRFKKLQSSGRSQNGDVACDDLNFNNASRLYTIDTDRALRFPSNGCA